MARPTLTQVTTGFEDVDAYNANLQAIEDAFDQCLFRDGTTPNVMNANLDMNGYTILNAIANGSTDANFSMIGDWAATTAYTANNIVYVTVSESATNGGASYICTTTHTSGATFDGDIANWQLLAKRGATGATGAGTGDMLAANNLSDVANAATSRTNLGLGDAATKTVGVANGNVIAADATGLPAIDGSQVTGVIAEDINVPGLIFPFIGTGTPTGRFLPLYGQTIGNAASGADYAGAAYESLFALVKDCDPNAGTEVWASNDTVILPDLRGYVIACLDNYGGSSANVMQTSEADTLGDKAGAENISLSQGQVGNSTDVLRAVGVASTGGPRSTPSSHNKVQPTAFFGYVVSY